jgi:hypothetical protein
MHFSTSLDTIAKVLSVMISAVALLPLVLWSEVADGAPAYITGAIVVLYAGFVLACYAWAPKSYSVSSGELRIFRSAGDKVFPLDRLTEVRRVEPREMKGTIRLWGNGGLFGYYGKMKNDALGTHALYATRRGNYVLLTIGGKRIVLTPDEPDAMVLTLSAYLRKV